MSNIAPNIPAQRAGTSTVKIVLIVVGCVAIFGLLVIGVVVGILLPSLGRAREHARETVVMTNMKQIGSGVRMYMDDWNGWYPSHLAPVLIQYGVPGKALHDPRGTRPELPGSLAMPPVKEWKSIAGDIDAHSDVTYLGAGLKMGRDFGEVPILYANERTSKGEWIIGFSDGSVRNVAEAEVGALMDWLNKSRAACGLGPVGRSLPVRVPVEAGGAEAE